MYSFKVAIDLLGGQGRHHLVNGESRLSIELYCFGFGSLIREGTAENWVINGSRLVAIRRSLGSG